MRVARYLMVFIIILVPLATGKSHGANTPTIAVGATVLSKNICKFNSAGSTTLTFSPNLDPMNPTIRTLSATLPAFFVCKGADSIASFEITDNRGIRNNYTLNNTGVLIPYTFTYSPSSASAARNVDQDLKIVVAIQPDDYQDAIAGIYSDTVILTIAP